MLGRLGSAPHSAALDVVEAFMAAIERADFDSARQCLSDREFTYRGPIGSFDDADSFLADASRVGSIVKRIERRRAFVDGDEVCLIHNFVSTLEDLANTRVAAWFRVRDGRIVCIEVFFDAHPYAALFTD